MAWGTLQVGRIVLGETYSISHQVNATTGDQSVTLTGQESAPPLTEAEARAKAEDLIAMMDRDTPIVFSQKTNHTGFYRVNDVGANITEWDEAKFFTWNLSLIRIGTDNAVRMESRLTGLTRQNDFSLTGERWHAPSIGAFGYTTIGSAPSATVRTGADGAISVYRGIPSGINPRWSVTAQSYMAGRVRFLVGGVERSGVGFRSIPTGWELNNGLVRVQPVLNALRVGAWTGGAWHDKDWGVFTDSSDLVNQWDQCTVLRNDPEMVTVRLVKAIAAGSAILDLTLRRGSRILEGYMQRSTSGELKVRLAVAEPFTNNSASGYIVASANDANGNRFAAGSARTFSTHANGGVLRAAATRFDFWVGVVAGGESAVSGDTATDLRNQYIGAMAEMTRAVQV